MPAGARDRAGEEGVDVAREERDVLDAPSRDRVAQQRALVRVPVPRVGVDRDTRREVEAHGHDLIGDQLPVGRRTLEAVDHVAALLGAHERGAAVERGGRIRAERHERVARIARLIGAELAGVEADEVDLPEPPRPVGAVRSGRVTHERHRLPPGVVPVGAPLEEWDRAAPLARAARQAPGVVVLDLVVVPDGEERGGGADRLQVWIGVVGGVLRAVLTERARGAVGRLRDRSHRAVEERLLVDVVAEADHEIHVLRREIAVRRVVAHEEVLAGEERDRHRLAAVRRRRGLEGAHWRALARAGLESVPVALARDEPPLDPHARGARCPGSASACVRAITRANPASVATSTESRLGAVSPSSAVQSVAAPVSTCPQATPCAKATSRAPGTAASARPSSGSLSTHSQRRR